MCVCVCVCMCMCVYIYIYIYIGMVVCTGWGVCVLSWKILTQATGQVWRLNYLQGIRWWVGDCGVMFDLLMLWNVAIRSHQLECSKCCTCYNDIGWFVFILIFPLFSPCHYSAIFGMLITSLSTYKIIVVWNVDNLTQVPSQILIAV